MEMIRTDRERKRKAAPSHRRGPGSPTVSSVMSRRPITVAADLLGMHAERIALSRGVHHLLVIEDERLVGMVCLCDLWKAESHATVADLMSTHLATVDGGTTLEDSLQMMNELAVGCLPVMDGEALVGVVTRGDLRRVGILTDQLIARTCASCGTRHHVKFDELGAGEASHVGFCLQCLERGRAYDAADPYDELGGEE